MQVPTLSALRPVHRRTMSDQVGLAKTRRLMHSTAVTTLTVPIVNVRSNDLVQATIAAVKGVSGVPEQASVEVLVRATSMETFLTISIDGRDPIPHRLLEDAVAASEVMIEYDEILLPKFATSGPCVSGSVSFDGQDDGECQTCRPGTYVSTMYCLFSLTFAGKRCSHKLR